MMDPEHSGHSLNDFSFSFGDAAASYSAGAVSGLSAWQTAYTPENDAFLKSRTKIVSRVKDLVRNEPLTRASINEKTNLTIGANWTVSPSPDVDEMPWEAEDNRLLSRYLRKGFMRDMMSRRFWIDAAGKNDLIGILQLDERTMFIEGESFVKINFIENPKGPIGFNAQVIDPGRIYTPSALHSDKSVVQGVRMSESGFAQGFYVHRYHQGSCRRNREEYTYVPTYNKLGMIQMVHNFVQWSPDLTRGITDLVTSVINAKKRGKMVDAALEDFVTKAQIALVIKSDKANIMEEIGVVQDSENDAARLEVMKQYLKNSGEWHQQMNIKHDNKQLLRLFDGEQLDGFSPDTHGGNYDSFVGNIDAMEARSHGLSAEMHTQRWHQTNFSGARSGNLSVDRNVRVWRQQGPEHLSQIFYELWVQDAILRNKIQLPGIANPLAAFEFYIENREALCQAKWYGPAKDEIDEAKRAARFKTEKSIGVSTLTRYCRTVLAEDPEDVLDTKFDELKMVNDRLLSCGYDPIPDPLRFLFPEWDLASQPDLIAPTNQADES